jgi:hypothetical protein
MHFITFCYKWKFFFFFFFAILYYEGKKKRKKENEKEGMREKGEEEREKYSWLYLWVGRVALPKCINLTLLKYIT